MSELETWIKAKTGLGVRFNSDSGWASEIRGRRKGQGKENYMQKNDLMLGQVTQTGRVGESGSEDKKRGNTGKTQVQCTGCLSWIKDLKKGILVKAS